ncbi:hypothetical protein THASP1DRAFT_31009 [Thamnocephalis sphaerospora]|uniref:NADH-ubiquinone oxidoreductase 14 kDa subunit n=1 Tax=Thamnocephalis sphaerospora TaxID=78915 RepID=A0A4P9XML1_9FUNG|nr:hypothetical protein THASP1DRAFT_31009 [Thamnocephalis sphaerospora]|eukprot:RKP07177.1 hypothetical protein THASP1DRAFT_31009 [Thamnocephalis sphaerospora]
MSDSTTVRYVAGYGAFGVAVRALQLGLQKRPLLTSNPLVYAANAAIFGGIGFWLSGVDARHRALIEEKKRILLENRARADAIRARRQAELQ